ncbi:hypothetical protein K2X05_13370, partial [bacterium]|nr:hypothetical protein [bacterium]
SESSGDLLSMSRAYRLTVGTVLILGATVAWFHFGKSKNTSNTVSHAQTTSAQKDTSLSLVPKAQETTGLLAQKTDTKTGFNYQQEVQTVLDLEKEWPLSKDKLINRILQEDYFKKNNLTVTPHSFDEILQRQMGAVRVFALKTLLEKEKSRDQKLQYLRFIFQQAKDPAMKSIAKAAFESTAKNRPFFEDTVTAISQLSAAD